MIYGITMGDSSGVGPEIVLNAFRSGELREDIVVFGDLAVLEYCNQRLGYGVPLHRISALSDRKQGHLNVRDFSLLTAAGYHAWKDQSQVRRRRARLCRRSRPSRTRKRNRSHGHAADE